MDRLVIKRGDTLPALRVVLSDGATPVDLTGATVRVILTRSNGTVVVVDRAPATATAEGVVTMPWQPGDTATAGQLRGEIEVTFPDGKKQTWPSTGQFTVEVAADSDSENLTVAAVQQAGFIDGGVEV